jgi:hypothetical protein
MWGIFCLNGEERKGPVLSTPEQGEFSYVDCKRLDRGEAEAESGV